MIFDRKMFNFLRKYCVPTQKRAYAMSIYTPRSMRICLFCNFHHLKLSRPTKYTFFRCYTTDTLERHALLKKKTKRRSKKYAELLEVTEQTTNNAKATVHKLNPAHVSAVADQSEVTLDKLHKVVRTFSTNVEDNNPRIQPKEELIFNNELDTVRMLKKSRQYLQDDTILEDLESNLNNHTLIKDSFFLNTLQQTDNKNYNQNDTDMQVSKSASNFKTFMKENRLEDFSDYNMSMLLAYMDVYIQIGMLQKAKKILILSTEKLKYNKHMKIAMLYNLLMEAYVSNAQLRNILEIYKIMKENSIQPKPETYALLFQLVARMKNHEKRAEIVTELTNDMTNKGISFNDVINTIMNPTRRKAVLLCIRLIDPKYRMQYKGIETAHECKLLQNLMTNSKYQSPAKGVVTMDELENMTRMQIDIEKQANVEVKSIATFNGDPHVRQQAINQIAELEKVWKSSVAKAFEMNLLYLKNSEIRMKTWKIFHPFLEVLPKEEYIEAILYEIIRLAKTSKAYTPSTSSLFYNLGNIIYKKYEFQCKMKTGVVDNTIEIYKKYLEWYIQTNSTNITINGRVKWQKLVEKAKKSGVYCDNIVPEWPHYITLNIGKFLYDIILTYVKIPYKPDTPTDNRQISAFYCLYRTRNSPFLTEEIKPHPYVHKLYADSEPETLNFDSVLLPTCSPPRPWIDLNAGGFLFFKTSFFRINSNSICNMASMHLLQNTPTKQLYPAFDCLNQLGSIPWKINKPILDILIQIFQKGGSEELNVPQSSSVLPSLRDFCKNKEIDHKKLLQLSSQLRRKKDEMYSLWCDCLYKLSLANHFRDKIFWLPHNLDFRGRAYPLPPHLTHLSSDLSRSILMFAQEKPLGPNGLDWLKIHTINLTGTKKKESIKKRLEYANEVLDLIIDSARNPLTGKMWWIKSDEPWQTLAACKEIDNALQSPNVEEYMSGLPIHQDGSCNGLQHYAALGRDQIGAESVNLYPSSTPQDVYSVVVSLVEKKRKADAKAGDELAKVLEGYVIRKVIKQTVMTTVYGVTKFGGRLQIARQLSDLKDFNQDYTWKASLYLVDHTFKSLQTMFTSAKEIQDWFTDCSRVISTRCNQYVQWVTPLGLPIVQPYFKRSKSTETNKLVNKPDTLKQKNAFPPNFIHSLDSCHMMLTSLHCEQAGLTFMSVHDCFWTHPCTVNTMNKICREQFVVLHSEPILEDLSKFFVKRYEKYFLSEKVIKRGNKDVSLQILGKPPKKGEFDIKNVLSSEYFFS